MTQIERIALALLNHKSREELLGITRRLFGVCPDAVIKALAEECPPDKKSALDQECIDFINSGRLVEAIRHYRLETNSSLIEARDYVYRLRDQL